MAGALAELKDLEAAHTDLLKVSKKHPEAVTAFLEVIKKHNRVGYKNLIRLATGWSPEEAKTGKRGK